MLEGGGGGSNRLCFNAGSYGVSKFFHVILNADSLLCVRFCCLHRSIEHTTCPICRNEMSRNDEFWVVPDIPTRNEIGQFVLGLAEGAGEPSS